jgi:hypothetical protein
MSNPETPSPEPSEPTLSDLLRDEIALDTAPTLPVWAATVIAAIARIIPIPPDAAFDALRALVEPIRAQAEGPAKDAVRRAKDAKLAEIHAAYRAAHTLPTTQRQVIPVVQAPPTAPASVAGDTVDETAYDAAPPERRPLVASYTKIRSGQYSGDWGARIEHTGQERPAVGDVITCRRQNGHTQLKRVDSIVWSDGNTTIATISDAPSGRTRVATPVAGAPVQAAPRTPSAPVAAPTTTVETVRMVSPSAASRQLRAVATATRSDVRARLSEGKLIAGAVDKATGFLQFSCVGGGSTTLGKVQEALAAIGREHDAPSSPSAERHAGRAVESLRGRDFDTKRLPTRDLPEGVKCRWLVGRALTGTVAQAGDAYGTALLLVDLRDDDTLAFDGDLQLATSVRSHYAAATAKETLRSEDMTPWLARIIRTRHYGVKRGVNWYVPASEGPALIALCEAIRPLWGDPEYVEGITSKTDLMRILGRGLMDELRAVLESLAADTELAKERARDKAANNATGRGLPEASIAAEAQLAYDRATISPRVASRLISQLATVAGRVAGYETVLGAEATTEAKAMIAAVRDTLAPLTDDTSLRAEMLELV